MASSESLHLLPCPFCGCPDIRLLPQPHGFSVDCQSCRAMKRYIGRFRVGAIGEWNLRLPPESEPCNAHLLKRNAEVCDGEDDLGGEDDLEGDPE